MENEIKIFWNGVKLNGELNRMRFSQDKTNGNVFFYAADYSAEMPSECGLVVVNNSDSQTDYFEKDHGQIPTDHPLYKFFKHAAIQADIHFCKGEIRQYERWEKKWNRDYSEEIARWTARLSEMEALEKAENPGQPTAEDFAKVEEYVAAKKAAAKAEREAQEAREAKERAAAYEEAKEIAKGTIETFEKAFPMKDGAPTVEISFSEFCGLYAAIDEKKATWSLAAADRIIGAIDTWVNKTRENSKYIGHYYKTDFTIRYTDENGEESTYQGRYDIGDGEGGLLNHIRSFGEWHRTHEEFGKEKAIPDETNDILEFVKMLEKAA